MSSQRPPVPGSRIQWVVASWLRPSEDGLYFPPVALDQVRAVVEMAARVPDIVFAEYALRDLVELMLALEAIEAPSGSQMRLVFSESEAAIARFAEIEEDYRRRSARFIPPRNNLRPPVKFPTRGVARAARSLG